MRGLFARCLSVIEPNTTVTILFLNSIVEQVHNDYGEPRNGPWPPLQLSLIAIAFNTVSILITNHALTKMS